MSSILKVDEIQNTSGTSALTIQSSGAVKKPNLPYLYADLHNGSSAAYDAHANQTPVQFRRVISSQGGITLNTSTYTFTVPLTGIYQINYQLLIQTAANLDFSVGTSAGNEIFRSFRYNARGLAASLAIPLNASATFQIRNTSGASHNIHRNTDATDRYTSLSVYLIS